MGDPIARALVVVVVGVSALVIGVLWRRGRAWIRHRRPLPGLEDGVYLFTSGTCGSCSAVRARLHSAGVTHTEITFELDPERFDTLGISKVPAIARVTGTDSWLAFGDPGAGAIHRWLGP